MSVSSRHALALALSLGAPAVGACGETTISIVDPVPAEKPLDLARGLLLHLPFDETEAGMVAVDASGNGHDGTPSATPPIPSLSVPPVAFANARSLSFDGVAQALDLGNPSGLDVEGPVTVAAWTRPQLLDGWRNIVAHGWHHQPDQEVALRVSDGVYEFLSWDGVDHAATAEVPAGDPDGWHHLCGVYDGRSYLLYRDGQLVAEHADALMPMRVEEAWAVGARGAVTDFDPRYYGGLIDEVRVYGRALSAEEVLGLFRL